jgi:hypothetical protein
VSYAPNTVSVEIISALTTPDDRARLDAVIEQLRTKARRWYFGSIAINSLLLVVVAGLAIAALNKSVSSAPAYSGVLICLVLMLCNIFAWPAAQHSERLSKIMFAHPPLPSGVAAAFASFITQDQVVTAGGELVDGRLFASSLAILLLSSDPFYRRMVRTPGNAQYSQGLIVLPESAFAGVGSCACKGHLSRTTGSVGAAVPPMIESEPVLPDFTRKNLSLTAGLVSCHAAWVRLLSIDYAELICRIEQLEVPGVDGRQDIAVKLALSAALPLLLGSNERGTLARAVKAGGGAVRRQFGQAGVSTDSHDWIRKLIAPPAPWLKLQLSTPPEQALLGLELPERPRLPHI